MDFWNLGAQDAMAQIALNDHTKAQGENRKEQEKNNLVVIAELHMTGTSYKSKYIETFSPEGWYLLVYLADVKCVRNPAMTFFQAMLKQKLKNETKKEEEEEEEEEQRQIRKPSPGLVKTLLQGYALNLQQKKEQILMSTVLVEGIPVCGRGVGLDHL
ncbi:hypothetical protein TURU_153481 [Turdus rufiventris]|nr:hypothetical protein TURU_153481 [Turdus rufiventris]